MSDARTRAVAEMMLKAHQDPVLIELEVDLLLRAMLWLHERGRDPRPLTQAELSLQSAAMTLRARVGQLLHASAG